MNTKKVMTGVGTTVLALILMSGTAFAHFCTNASRSEQGKTSVAEHSQGWLSVDDFARMAELCEAGVAHVVAGFNASEWNNLVIHGRSVMANGLQRRNTGLLQDGRGIDHTSEEEFPQIEALFNALVVEARNICSSS